jgi:uncharacterized protein YbaR (Trm112 family)
MPVSPDLLAILICPSCKAKVELTQGGDGLRCVGCGLVYPVRDGIPVMLVSEARREGSS